MIGRVLPLLLALPLLFNAPVLADELADDKTNAQTTSSSEPAESRFQLSASTAAAHPLAAPPPPEITQANTGGVDILDESLKFHAQVNTFNPPNLQPQLQCGYNNNGMQSQQNNSMPGYHNNGGAFNSAGMHQYAGMCQHPMMYGNATMYNGNHMMQCNGMHCHESMKSNSGGQLNTQMVGAVGAAVLLGSFMNNGGIGGMMRSVGWDNRRHIRGPTAY